MKTAARELLALQRSDGGWSQEPSLESDSYATGEALTALLESGMAAADDPAVRRAVEFLLRTQLQDGSWYVKSRSVPIQAYFESGFPHGADQWISAAGTAWAVRALANVHEAEAVAGGAVLLPWGLLQILVFAPVAQVDRAPAF